MQKMLSCLDTASTGNTNLPEVQKPLLGQTKKEREQMIADYAYAAGIIDGEGTIHIQKRMRPKRCKNPAYSLIVSAVNTDKPLIDWLQKKFGGNHTAKRLPPNDRRRPYWEWRRTGKAAAQILEKILPYLKQKREKAILGLKFQMTIKEKTQPYQLTSEKIVLQREQIRNQILALTLNRRWQKCL
jgi:hypothetical protein